MKVFLSLLTVYTYPSKDSRVPLNRQEAAKFLDALQEAPTPDRILIISDVSMEEFEERLKEVTDAEKKDFQMVLRSVTRRPAGTVNWLKVNLLNYREVKERTLEALQLMLGGVRRGRVEIHANLGCGRKVATVAVYVALMEFAHGKGFYSKMCECKFRVRPYQVEEGKVTEFPVLSVKSISAEMGHAMEMLAVAEGGVDLEALRVRTRLTHREFDRALAHLRNFGYVEFVGGKIRPTVKGRTLLRIWKALEK